MAVVWSIMLIIVIFLYYDLPTDVALRSLSVQAGEASTESTQNGNVSSPLGNIKSIKKRLVLWKGRKVYAKCFIAPGGGESAELISWTNQVLI